LRSEVAPNVKFCGVYTAPPDPLAGGEGCPLPKNPTSVLGPSGFGLRPKLKNFAPSK